MLNITRKDQQEAIVGLKDIASDEESDRCCKSSRKNVGQSMRQFRGASEEQLVAARSLSLGGRWSRRRSCGDESKRRRSSRGRNARRSNRWSRTASAGSASGTAGSAASAAGSAPKP
jgi:hypothetical protein